MKEISVFDGKTKIPKPTISVEEQERVSDSWQQRLPSVYNSIASCCKEKNSDSRSKRPNERARSSAPWLKRTDSLNGQGYMP